MLAPSDLFVGYFQRSDAAPSVTTVADSDGLRRRVTAPAPTAAAAAAAATTTAAAAVPTATSQMPARWVV